jgi:UDP-N-acetyl-D-mannosaminuronate dehydrogenase
MKIAVIGLGYVGLPLSLQFARSCVTVLGLDADPKKVELLNDGQSYIKHIQSAEIAELVDAGKFYASTDFGQIKEVEAVIICVPTPLNKNREPDLFMCCKPASLHLVWLISSRRSLGRSYCPSWRSSSSGHWFSETCFDEC